MPSILANLTPAKGRQDHTTSPSALTSLVWRHQRVHRIPRSTSVTTRNAPPIEAGWAAIAVQWMQKQSEIFFRAGLDDPNQLERLHEIDLYAHVICRTVSAFTRNAGLPNAQIDLPDGQINLATSSRANGSRECAPDDGLREAIQIHERDWIASSPSLLAMTASSKRTKRKYFFSRLVTGRLVSCHVEDPATKPWRRP